MPVIELLSMLGGSAVGFLFRFIAQKSQDQKELFQQMMTANARTTDNQNKAAERVGIDVGRGVRQVIVLSTLFATFLAPFVLPFFGVPTFVEVDATQTNFLGSDVLRKYFVEINGFLFTSENRQILLSIVGFYFGSAAASNKS